MSAKKSKCLFSKQQIFKDDVRNYFEELGVYICPSGFERNVLQLTAPDDIPITARTL